MRNISQDLRNNKTKPQVCPWSAAFAVLKTSG